MAIGAIGRAIARGAKPLWQAIKSPAGRRLGIGAGTYMGTHELQRHAMGPHAYESAWGEHTAPALAALYAMQQPWNAAALAKHPIARLSAMAAVPASASVSGGLQRMKAVGKEEGLDPDRLMKFVADLSVQPKERAQEMLDTAIANWWEREGKKWTEEKGLPGLQQAAEPVAKVVKETGPAAAGEFGKHVGEQLLPDIKAMGQEALKRFGMGTGAGVGTYLLANALLKGMIPSADAGKMLEDGVITPQEMDEYYQSRRRREALRQGLSGLLGAGVGYGTMAWPAVKPLASRAYKALGRRLGPMVEGVREKFK